MSAECELCASHSRGIVCEKQMFGTRTHFPPIKDNSGSFDGSPRQAWCWRNLDSPSPPPGAHLNALIARTWQEGPGRLCISGTTHTRLERELGDGNPPSNKMVLFPATKRAPTWNVHVAGGYCAKPDDGTQSASPYHSRRPRNLWREKKMILLSTVLCILFQNRSV